MHAQFQGTLTHADAKQHIARAFPVPADASELRISLVYTPERVPGGLNSLHLTLFDSRGFRGAGHRPGDVQDGVVRHDVAINATAATPGYLPGPLPAGDWSVVIDSHMILPDAPISYTISIEIDCGQPAPAPEPAPPAPRTPRGPGWYRGNLHGHTIHSDSQLQVAELLGYAKDYQLDFVTLSDHNTTSGLDEFMRLAPLELLPIGGIELTTYYGHALALGLREWVDWRVRPGERSMPQIAAEVMAAGGLFVIAHPMSVGDPICTGCDWRYRDMMPGPARCVEIWNGGLWEGEGNNENALALWYSWLNQGHRMVATAGTDIHGPAPLGFRLGHSVVYAEELSQAAILRAISLGHLYLSDGPQLELSGQSAGGAQAIMGDALPAEEISVVAAWRGAEAGDRLRVITDGRPLFEQEAGAEGQQQLQIDAGRARWCTLELRTAGGVLRAITNPLFIGASWERAS